MINRYAGEIHINPIRILRDDDFNNDGHIKDIDATLKQVIDLSQKIGDRMKYLNTWLQNSKGNGAIQFHFADAGYISIKGLSDDQLKQLAAKGLIELFDNAKDKDWVKKYGPQFGLIWENGRAVEL